VTDLSKFKTAIQPYYNGWKSIDMRAVCIFAYEKWIIIGMRLFLSEKPAKNSFQEELLPAFPGFSAFHEVRDIKELDGLLSQIEKGILTITDKEIYLGRIINNEVQVIAGPSNLWCYFHRRSPRWRSIDYEFPTIVIGKRGESIFDLLHNNAEAIGQDHLDWQLRSLESPYEGLDDLLISFLEIPKPSWGSVRESAFIEVLAPIRVRLGDGCKLSQNRLDIYVEAVGYEKLNEISIGLIERSGNATLRRISITLTETDWRKKEDHPTLHKIVNVEGATLVVIFLRFRGNSIDMLTVNDPFALLKNPRILAFSHFDEDLSVLKRYLWGKGKVSSDDFEIGVSLLLHFCGLNIGHYGGVNGIKEEIDIIAFVPFSNHIVAGECTLKDIDVNVKLSKLSRRGKELKERLIEFLITPLIFTALEGAKISKSDLKKAKEERIGVVAIEEIQELLEMAGQNRPLNEILNYLQNLVPEDLESFFKRDQ